MELNIRSYRDQAKEQAGSTAGLSARASHFSYEIEDARGNRKNGLIRARTLQEAIRRLDRQSVRIISLKKAEAKSLLHLCRWDDQGILVFFRQLAIMIKCGLTLKHAITVIKSQQQSSGPLEILGNLEQGLERGMSFSECLSLFPHLFSKFQRSLIKAAEQGGFLDKSLEYIATVTEKSLNMRKKVSTALNYPLAVLIIGLTGSLTIFYWIFPYMKMLVSDLHITLPFCSRVMFNLADSFKKLYISIPLVILGLLGIRQLVDAVRNTIQGRLIWERILTLTPVVKDIRKKEILIHALYILASLTESGIPLVPSIELASESCGNLFMEGAFQEVNERIREGSNFSDALALHPSIFPRSMVAMVAVGEESGTLSDVLERTAAFYETELLIDIEGFTKLVEPLAIGILGLLVGFMIVSFLVPVYMAMNHF